ncbi:MAG: branched-chain amino acid ABC transporter permease [Deltaproteobacteria bacterium]|nr:branched-chain amino acid ABC transporter permease [Deltaproteobacteria bacterium]
MALTFPLLVVRVNTVENVVAWRWRNLVWVGLGAFAFSLGWRRLLAHRTAGGRSPQAAEDRWAALRDPRVRLSAGIAVGLFALVFPLLFSSYQVNILITALIYVVLGLGLNIVVGLAGLLDLGYVAFYAVGAYSYALLNKHFGLGFWGALPAGMGLAALFGILLGFPVLRLRGDYLAIVTLGFGEIIRLILENWNEFSYGPSGIANIPRPSLFGVSLSLERATVYLYYLMLAAVAFTIFVVNRLKHSRLGRSWLALREDEIACQAMGIDRTRTKLAAFALGATWAGMGGVIFAAKTSFVNPASFTFLESAMVLSIVVLGGMGSNTGVILAALLLVLLPEYLRAFSDYRMLLFGAIMVVMMVFRPQGLVGSARRKYELQGAPSGPGPGEG